MKRKRTDAAQFSHGKLRGFVPPLAGALIALLLSILQTAAAFQSIDLSRAYTTRYLVPAPPFPLGAQTLGEVPFVIGGRIEVTGMDAARSGEFLPPHVTGIAVNQKAARLHLLLGARHGQKEGAPLANVVLRFRNGDTRLLRLAFGVHARNTVEQTAESVRPLADPNSSVVWSDKPRGKRASSTHLYKTVLINPQPADEITSIDFVSLFSRGTPMIFAVTLESGDDLPALLAVPKRKVIERANEFADAAYRRDLRVRVIEAGGKPLTNATATLTVKDDGRSFHFGQYTSDAGGEIVISYPPQEAVSLNLRVNSPGFVPGGKTLSINDSEKWPEQLELSLERGASIGGVVVDGSGKPVADASVIPFEVVQTGSNQFTRTDFDLARSEADGRWRTTAQSQSVSNLSFEVRHPEHRLAFFSQFASADLLGSKVRMTLDPEVRIAGRVVNRGNIPLTNAAVILDLGDSSTRATSTDAKGRFSFIVRDATNSSAAVIVTVTNHAPVYRRVALEANGVELADIVLDAGQPFRMKMVDSAARPIPGVTVSLFRWEGSSAMQWTTQTDAEGRFRWDHAPAGPVTFQYKKPDYSRHTHSMTLPMSSEMTFTYSRPTRIAGRVVDADTRKPIDQFRVRFKYRYKSGGGSTSTTGSKGRFSTMLGSSAYEEIAMVLEARGYEPFATNVPPNEGSYSNVFQLKKGKLIPGVVLAPNGSPVAKAEVVLLDRATSAYMDEPGKFRRNSTMFETVVADANGKFELTPKLDADLVLAAHPQIGFVQMPFSDLTNSGKLVLKPWGRVQGVLRVGQKVEPYYYAALYTVNVRDSDTTRTSPGLYAYLKTKPGSDGRFVFDAVPPGQRAVYLRYLFNDKESGSMKLGHGVSVTVKSGETNDVVIGGSGRTVVGKVNVTGANGIQIDWRRDQQSLRRQAVSQVPPPITFPPNATPEQRRQLLLQRSEAMNARMRAENLIERTYALVIEDDGTFHVHNVPVGTYMLQLSAVQSQSNMSYRHLGSMSQQVVVPEGTGSHDVGIVSFQLRQ